MQLKRVDFNNSNIISPGTSIGLHKLVSVLTINNFENSDKIKTYGLGQSILAGNMYVKKGLLKNPPYLFQISGSASEQKIFRTFLPNSKKIKFPEWVKNDNTGDTYGNPLIKDFQINIFNEYANEINEFNEIKSSLSKNSFTAKVTFTNDDSTYNLEFPINHINIKSKSKVFQVETGPVLFPLIHRDEYTFEFLPSFIHFNVSNRMDIFYDYPFGIRTGENIVKNHPCKIQLFSR